MQYEYIMRLKTDLKQTDEEGRDLMRSVMQQAAQMVLAQATICAAGRRPQISVTCDNYFDDTEKIEVFDGDAELHDG